MIQTETIDGRIRHFSDNGKRIRQVETSIVYDDALDVIPCPYTYEETDEDIPTDDLSAEDMLNQLNTIVNG